MTRQLLLALVAYGGVRSGYAQAAAEAAAPSRLANVVRLYTPAAPAEVLRVLAENLRQRGFELDSVAYEAGLVTTKPGIPSGTESWPLVVRLAKFAGGIELTGTFTTGMADGAKYPVECWGFDWSPAKRTFRELEATARSCRCGEVRFSRRKVASCGTVN